MATSYRWKFDSICYSDNWTKDTRKRPPDNKKLPQNQWLVRLANHLYLASKSGGDCSVNFVVLNRALNYWIGLWCTESFAALRLLKCPPASVSFVFYLFLRKSYTTGSFPALRFCAYQRWSSVCHWIYIMLLLSPNSRDWLGRKIQDIGEGNHLVYESIAFNSSNVSALLWKHLTNASSRFQYLNPRQRLVWRFFLVDRSEMLQATVYSSFLRNSKFSSARALVSL